MEPLSARGLPRLSWIDTLYSSTYPSVSLFTPRRTSLPIYLRSTLMPFLPSNPPPSSSTAHGLPVCVMTTLIFPLVLQLVGITVAVHNKTVTPDTLYTQSCPHLRTLWWHSLLSVVVVVVVRVLFYLFFHRHREPGKPGECCTCK